MQKKLDKLYSSINSMDLKINLPKFKKVEFDQGSRMTDFILCIHDNKINQLNEFA